MNGSIFIEGRRMMEKPVIRISVRNLVEFILAAQQAIKKQC